MNECTSAWERKIWTKARTKGKKSEETMIVLTRKNKVEINSTKVVYIFFRVFWICVHSTQTEMELSWIMSSFCFMFLLAVVAFAISCLFMFSSNRNPVPAII